MTTEIKRDLAADLAICEAATVGPWTHSRWAYGYVMTEDERCETVASVVEYNADGSVYKELGGENWQSNRTFIAEAREGWPEAIRRAIDAESRLNAAEAEVEQLRSELMTVFQRAKNDVRRREGGMSVGTATFADYPFARRLIRDLTPILFPEVTASDTQENNGR